MAQEKQNGYWKTIGVIALTAMLTGGGTSFAHQLLQNDAVVTHEDKMHDNLVTSTEFKMLIEDINEVKANQKVIQEDVKKLLSNRP